MDLHPIMISNPSFSSYLYIDFLTASNLLSVSMSSVAAQWSAMKDWLSLHYDLVCPLRDSPISHQLHDNPNQPFHL